MKPRIASRLAWSLFGVAIVLAALALLFLILGRSSPQPAETFGFRGFAAIFAIVFGAVGALIASRRSENPIGWILCAIGVGSGLQEFAQQYAIYATLARPGVLPAGEVAAWVPTWIWVPLTGSIALFWLLFPSGRLPSSRWALLIWITAAGLVVASAGLALAPGPLENFGAASNPFGVGSDRRWWLQLANVGLGLYGIGLIGSAASLVFRFRRSAGEERQQLKWLAFASAIVAVALISSFGTVGPGGAERFKAIEMFVILSFLGVPVATAVAILRYRLYDIDLIINRTLVFAALAAFITAVYLGIVIGIGTLVGSRGNLVLSVLATALIAVGFQPVRERARHLANRLVYGQRATPYEVLSEFSQRMGGYASEEVLAQMAHLLSEGTGASRAEIWLRVGTELQLAASWPAWSDSKLLRLPVTGEEAPQIPDSDAAFPVSYQSELLGVVSIRMPPAEPLTPVIEKLVSDLAFQAALILRNVRLLAELRASRQRIVAAQDEERRRLERDIHDAAQQQLVALAVKAGLARNLLDRDTQKTARILDEIKIETNEIVETVRELARGVFPPVLAEKGIVSALRSDVTKMGINAKLETDSVGDARFNPQTEAAVYFCIREALQNASKHAPDTPITISFSFKNRSLEFSVRDQGPGFDPKTAKAGSGLQNMVDRIEALGGQLEILSEADRGTNVVGRVPAKIAEPLA
jgi:signal transduction histidine kinase